MSIFLKTFYKKLLRNRNWALVNTRYRWGVDLYADIKKVLADNQPITAMDIGSNDGTFAKELIESLPVKTLYAFEPGSRAFSKLSSRFAGSGVVSCLQYAVGEQSGTCTLYTFPDSRKNTTDFSMHDQMRPGEGKPEEIQMTSITEFAEKNQLTGIDFLKIDVEGLELSVLKGAAGMLADQKIKLVYCEFHKILASENKNSPHTNLVELVEFLGQYGYRFIALYTQGVHNYEDLVTCNVLFAPKMLFFNK